jgi:hypothetical protein
MALKITTQIGTDAGITTGAYVRIVNYSINKNGSAEFKLQLFKSEEDSIEFSLRPVTAYLYEPCRNREIGEELSISFLKEVDEILIVKKLVPIEKIEETTVIGPPDENGNPTTITSTLPKTEIVEQDVETIVKKTVADLSSIQNIDIFTVGYKALKNKLIGLYGQENIKDC